MKAAVKAILFCVPIMFAVQSLFGQTSSSSPAGKSDDVYKNLQVLNHISPDLLLPSMQFISSSLGVHCGYCHVEDAFDRDDKPMKIKAREMMQMVLAINANRFQGKQDVTCYSCHRGSPEPVKIPLIASTTPSLLSQPASVAPPTASILPRPEDVVKNYITVLGGISAISNLHSLNEEGTFQSDARAFPVQVLRAGSGQIATITHFGENNRIEAFDGTSGWLVVPGRPARPMNPGEADAARLQADLHLALEMSNIFLDLKVKGSPKIGGQDAIELSCERPGLPPVEMYFDTRTGLLVRTVHYVPSALGLNPTQTDYFDYRPVAGVKLPFRWISATPTGRFTIQITNAQVNEPIPTEAFSRPASLEAQTDRPPKP